MRKSILPWKSCLSFWSPWKSWWQVTSLFGMLLLKGLNIRQLDGTWFFRGCTYGTLWKSSSFSPKNASKIETAAHFSMQDDSISLCARAHRGTVIYQVILFNFCSGWDHSLKGVRSLLPGWLGLLAVLHAGEQRKRITHAFSPARGTGLVLEEVSWPAVTHRTPAPTLPPCETKMPCLRHGGCARPQSLGWGNTPR